MEKKPVQRSMRRDRGIFGRLFLLFFLFFILAIVLIVAFNFQKEEPTDIKTSEQKEEKKREPAFPALSETIDQKVQGVSVISNPNSLLLVVNKKRSLPEGFVPQNLVVPNVEFSFSGEAEKKYLRQEAAEALEKLFAEGEKEGIKLYAVSGYRSYDRQITVFNQHVQEYGEVETKKVSAVPGTSEHQTGLAIDVSSQSANFLLTEQFGETEEGKWLKENAYKQGYIIRYPKGKEEETGYSYEPWHIRYVGKEHAAYLYKQGLTLEEASR
ncbi:D-alanyl-D-alanine carboxypeptidase [Priestia endophytica]|jgi:LAS superfamily LD-carboxypeptidase LdcB|nr:M15 family metallopeptidase [Priestia endophytica]MED4070469.1 M15 family metallopeptidase [Priestia endophytica]RPK15650.1 D-alanyl-D-alanine carboxypeptidase [Priestia endophytica]